MPLLGQTMMRHTQEWTISYHIGRRRVQCKHDTPWKEERFAGKGTTAPASTTLSNTIHSYWHPCYDLQGQKTMIDDLPVRNDYNLSFSWYNAMSLDNGCDGIDCKVNTLPQMIQIEIIAWL